MKIQVSEGRTTGQCKDDCYDAKDINRARCAKNCDQIADNGGDSNTRTLNCNDCNDFKPGNRHDRCMDACRQGQERKIEDCDDAMIALNVVTPAVLESRLTVVWMISAAFLTTGTSGAVILLVPVVIATPSALEVKERIAATITAVLKNLPRSSESLSGKKLERMLKVSK
eukprot:CAMPEP_0172310512 /NCGR_PEP_ID=MMETSP1058-20130122/11523_1 /TAXON_ID=83371 /ORGANISM="Detonula confervacea, Strain CCMP 353" /LENGTH=169 /DNA_ID=CAMNT_0013023321 /DNA_START=12 /DNA_END=522 /DNA_ORIENTATION=+